MCVIVDADVASAVFRKSPDPDFAPVARWLYEKDGGLAVGGQLREELGRMKLWGLIVQLSRAGRAFLYPEAVIKAEEARVADSGCCKSNDPHVIALARVSGARTLCSHDKDLHADFKNRDLVKPRGYVYQNPDHDKHLCHTPSCRQGRSQFDL